MLINWLTAKYATLITSKWQHDVELKALPNVVTGTSSNSYENNLRVNARENHPKWPKIWSLLCHGFWWNFVNLKYLGTLLLSKNIRSCDQIVALVTSLSFLSPNSTRQHPKNMQNRQFSGQMYYGTVVVWTKTFYTSIEVVKSSFTTISIFSSGPILTDTWAPSVDLTCRYSL